MQKVVLINQIDDGKWEDATSKNFSGCISPSRPSFIMTERFLICSLSLSANVEPIDGAVLSNCPMDIVKY